MPQLRLCLHTQTPFARFLRDFPEEPTERTLSSFGTEDYQASPGGVTRMVGGLLRRLTRERRVSEADWIALSTQGPSRVRLAPGVRLLHARLAEGRLKDYAHAKARFWSALHDPSPTGSEPPMERIDAGLGALSDVFGRLTARLHSAAPFDVFYTHDFQLLPLARRLPPEVPRLFRWHVPIPQEGSPLLGYAVDRMNEYDAVIVSTRAYASRLRSAGVFVPIHARYPYLDENRRRVVTTEDLRAFDARWNLAEDDVIFALVARMDPIKSHDAAIRALARIRPAHPKVKLLLVGGGGFSGGKRGGLGLSEASTWRERLEILARSLGVSDRVVFTGNVDDNDLAMAYARSRAVLLPSRVEGFGLVAIEGWLHGRPVVVSRGAGVAELVRDGHNGYSFDPQDVEALAEALAALAEDPQAALRMGEAGRVTAAACHLAKGADGIWAILKGAVESRLPAPWDRRTKVPGVGFEPTNPFGNRS